MKEFTYTIQDPVGIHARPAGILTKEAQALPDEITLILGDRSANLKKLLAVMGLGIRHGDTVTVRIEGAHEEASCRHLQSVFEAYV